MISSCSCEDLTQQFLQPTASVEPKIENYSSNQLSENPKRKSTLQNVIKTNPIQTVTDLTISPNTQNAQKENQNDPNKIIIISTNKLTRQKTHMT